MHAAQVLLRLLVVVCTVGTVWCVQPATVVAQDDEEKDELFAFPPRTPVRLIRAAILADKLDRPLLAQKYLQRFLDNQPSADTLRRLRGEIGLSPLLKLSATPRLQPESQQVLKLVNESTPYDTMSQTALEDLVNSLGQSQAITTDASLKLMGAGDDAVMPLLNAGTETRPGKIAHEILHRYPDRFRAGLINVMETESEELQVRSIKYLTRTADSSLGIKFLPLRFSDSPAVAEAATEALRNLNLRTWAATTPANAVFILLKEAETRLQTAHETASRQGPIFGSDDGDSEVTPPEEEATVPDDGSIALQEALDLTTEALAIQQSDKAEATKLAVEAAMNAWPAAWPETQDASGPKVDSNILKMALQTGQKTSSVASLLQLLKSPTPQLQELMLTNPELTRQLYHNNDPRVRLLTATAIYEAEGAPAVTESIIRNIAEGSRKPEAVVIDPRYAEGSLAAGILRENGYNVTFERTGKGGFSAAAEELRCELLLIHSNCIRWPLSVTLANLRTDYRTSNVPIVIYGPQEHAANVVAKVQSDDGVWFEAEPLSQDVLTRSLQLKDVPGPVLDEAQRLAMEQFARDLLK